MDRPVLAARQGDVRPANTESIGINENGLIRKGHRPFILNQDLWTLPFRGKVLLTTPGVLRGHRASCIYMTAVMTMRRRKATPLDRISISFEIILSSRVVTYCPQEARALLFAKNRMIPIFHD